jgi:hypothetical protein
MNRFRISMDPILKGSNNLDILDVVGPPEL